MVCLTLERLLSYSGNQKCAFFIERGRYYRFMVYSTLEKCSVILNQNVLSLLSPLILPFYGTVEPPYNGQLETNVQCPLFGGVRCVEVSYCFTYFGAQSMFCSAKALP